VLVVHRYNPSNPLVLLSLIDYCRQAYGQDLSLARIQNELSRQVSTTDRPRSKLKSTTLVETYINYMKDAFFLYCPATYSYRIKDVLKQQVDKIYLSDLGFADHDAGAAKGRLLENMVYLEIIRRQFTAKRFISYRNNKLEIDFWIKKNNREALIQVCWQLGSLEENAGMWDREFGNLGSVSWDLPKIVVSLDHNVRSPVKGVEHMSVPEFLKWLD
jgi:predicted AAA+ superfamily ATPase